MRKTEKILIINLPLATLIILYNNIKSWKVYFTIFNTMSHSYLYWNGWIYILKKWILINCNVYNISKTISCRSESNPNPFTEGSLRIDFTFLIQFYDSFTFFLPLMLKNIILLFLIQNWSLCSFYSIYMNSLLVMGL